MKHLNIPEEISVFPVALGVHCSHFVFIHMLYHVINKYLPESNARPRLLKLKAAMTSFDHLGLSSHQSQAYHSHHVLFVFSWALLRQLWVVIGILNRVTWWNKAMRKLWPHVCQDEHETTGRDNIHSLRRGWPHFLNSNHRLWAAVTSCQASIRSKSEKEVHFLHVESNAKCIVEI